MIPPPHPVAVATIIASSNMPTNAFHLRLRRGKQKRSSAAAIVPPPPSPNRGCFELRREAVAVPVVLMVSEAVTGVVPEMAEGWLMEQVGISIAAAGLSVSAQVRATVPVNPPLGVTVIVDVAVAPDAEILIALPLSEKEGVAAVPFTVIVNWDE